MNIILIAGLGAHPSIWAPQVTALASLTTATTPEHHLGMDSITSMARALLMKINKPTLIAGTSLGSFIALEMARQNPDKVAGLALFGSTIKPVTQDRKKFLNATALRIKQEGFANYLNANCHLAMHEMHQQDQTKRKKLLNSGILLGEQSYLNQLKALHDLPNFQNVLQRFKGPVHIICGRQDKISPLADSLEIKRISTNAKLHIIEDCGHLAYLEQPEEVNNILLTFIFDYLSQPYPR